MVHLLLAGHNHRAAVRKMDSDREVIPGRQDNGAEHRPAAGENGLRACDFEVGNQQRIDRARTV